jgi:TfoX/Sxy family transcriptional regulator of competence genes
MQIPKPSDADKQYFTSLIPDRPDVEIKPMFGNLGAFVNGNMFAGLFGPAVGVRLPDDDRDELAAITGTGPFGPAERPMGGYLSLPAAWRDQPGIAAGWVDKALTHVRTFPERKKSPKKR